MVEECLKKAAEDKTGHLRTINKVLKNKSIFGGAFNISIPSFAVHAGS